MSLAGDDLVIRKARAQDYDAIVRNGDVYGGKDYLPALYPRAVTDPDFYPIVAEVKGEIVGFMMERLIDGGLSIITMAGRTVPAYRNKGVMHKMGLELLKDRPGRCPAIQYLYSAVRDKVAGRAADDLRLDGYVEILRKPITSWVYHLKDLCSISSTATEGLPPVIALEYEDLKALFDMQDIVQRLFPLKRLFNNYIGYRCLECNIRHLLDLNKEVCINTKFSSWTLDTKGSTFPTPESTNPEPDKSESNDTIAETNIAANKSPGETSGSTKMSALRGIDVVTFSEWFMAEAGLVYVVDVYARDGHSEASLQAHIARHLRHLLQLNLCDQGVFVVSLTNNVSEEKVRALLKHHGIVEPLPETEKWKALHEKKLETWSDSKL
ncbi:histidine N-acetyltransferase [Biomphalaria glabrata]|nr:histidine N-acetyltransferase-like [Biomphalaria glabrata]